MNKFKRKILLLIILIFAFFLRMWGIDNGLPYCQLPEETNEIKRAFIIAREEIVSGHLKPAS